MVGVITLICFIAVLFTARVVIDQSYSQNSVIVANDFGVSPILSESHRISDIATRWTEASLTTSNSSCPVLSPFDSSCGFVVNPPSWASAYPQLDSPIWYFDNGTYGITWINSTAYTVITPKQNMNRVDPAACVITVPSGTVILSQNSTQLHATLPNMENVTIPVPSYSFCHASPTASSTHQASSGVALTDPLQSAQSPTSEGTNVPINLFYDNVQFYKWTNFVNYVYSLNGLFYAPSPPGTFSCGSQYCPPYPQFSTEAQIYDGGSGNDAGSGLFIQGTCWVDGTEYCSWYWTLQAFYYYNSQGVASTAYDVSSGDQIYLDPWQSGGTTPYVCGDGYDDSTSQHASVCTYMSGESYLSSIQLQFSGQYFACSNYPQSDTYYYQIFADNQSGDPINIDSWNSAQDQPGGCGPTIGGYQYCFDLMGVTTGDYASVDFEYNYQNTC